MRRALLFAICLGGLCVSQGRGQSLSPTSTQIVVNNSSVVYGDPNTYTAIVESTGAGQMTGTVVFNTNGPSIGGASFSGPSKYVFGSPSSYPAQLGTVDLVAGDFNGDGIPDLAILNQCGNDGSCSTGGTVSILKNSGNGKFGTGVTLPVSAGATSITSADFNKDGHPDIAVANANSGVVTVHFSVGDGTFNNPTQFASLANVNFIRPGTFTTSGFTDVVVVGTTQSQIAVHRFSGSRFTGPTITATGANPGRLAVGDFNGDGLDDVAVIIAGNGFAPPNVSVFLSNGDGTFQTGQTLAAGSSPQDIAVGDFNGDGKLDLVVSDPSKQNLNILLGKGDGTFQNAIPNFTGASPTRLAVGDFNSDGHLDVVFTDPSTKTVAIAYGNGDGTVSTPEFSSPVQSNFVQWGFAGITFNDGGTVKGSFTYNPSIDLFSDWNFTSAGGNTSTFPPFTWLPSNSAPNTFAPGIGSGTYQFTENSTSHQIRFKPNGSLANPGGLSLAIGDAFGNTECFNCSPFRQFSTGALTSMPSVFAIVAADFDGGGLPDIATTDVGTAMVLLGTQQSTAVLTDSSLPAGSYQVFADFKGDSKFLPSSSPSTSVDVFQAFPNITATSDTPVALATDNVTLRAHVSFTVGQPTGTVQFLQGDFTIAFATVDASGDAVATIPASNLGVGTFSMLALYLGDSNFNSNSVSFTQTVIPVADLSVTVIPPAVTVSPGSPFTYFVRITNNGPGDATAATASLTLPPGTNLVSVSNNCSVQAPLVTCSIGFIGASSFRLLQVELSAPLVGSYSLSASVTNPNEVDINSANNASSASATVNGADLILSAPSAPTSSGGNTAYKVTVTNAGPSAANSVVLTDSLTRYQFISASSSVGACSFDGILISCPLGSLAFGASATVTVVVSAPSSGWASNEFHVQAFEPDPNPSNNVARLDPSSKATPPVVIVSRPSRRQPPAPPVGPTQPANRSVPAVIRVVQQPVRPASTAPAKGTRQVQSIEIVRPGRVRMAR